MNEKLLEKKLRVNIEMLGGKAIKFLSTYWAGAPDRIVLLPGGKIYWVELKSTGEKLRDLQETRKKQLEKLGFKVFTIDCQQNLDLFLQEVKRNGL